MIHIYVLHVSNPSDNIFYFYSATMPVAENAKQQEVAREASAAAAVAAEGGASAASASAGAGAAAARDDDDEVVLLNASSPCGLVRCDLFQLYYD